MRKLLLNLVIALLLIVQHASGQSTEKQLFGTKGIDHEAIAIEFMNHIRQEDYAKGYNFLSEAYKSEFNLEDFTFKMKMLNDLAGAEDFHHYHTTFIGKTAKEGLALINGKTVTENIMPEYDFTVGSEAEKSFKSVQIFIRFDNENSDKLRVINFSKHQLLDEKIGMSSVSSNPFIVGSYILLADHENEIYLDIRGGDLRNKFKTINGIAKDEILIKTSLDKIENLLSSHDLTGYSLIYVVEKRAESNEDAIRDLAGKNGFSIFNHRNKEFKSKYVASSATFMRKYKEGNWNPLGE
ncbi:hypothetical protein [Flavilitoribacter nigricans]|uniref:Uncharacterized protein n=1 Tax=Flavilitoribacter nigricans (strain ATCC 23147 / DSM 23189 / NBRC 102662 / NCIMB 1420 / SS-2) TaxID=1122177 RepID=A0A2D0N209_FLAN2|nr:hypothetical protein [Flavilitoribacter nigricans]PHN02535.1 hypothetical protein CRP01_31660 [Flavilitoribacter nigricans DSM 23189 = NBRC 102662]